MRMENEEEHKRLVAMLKREDENTQESTST